MSEFTKGVREMVALLKGAIIARPNDPDGESVGNIANLLELCADKIEDAEQQLAEREKRIDMAIHWATHAMLMRSSQNNELLGILRGYAIDKEVSQ
jgi:hypothetical protein